MTERSGQKPTFENNPHQPWYWEDANRMAGYSPHMTKFISGEIGTTMEEVDRIIAGMEDYETASDAAQDAVNQAHVRIEYEYQRLKDELLYQ